MSTGDSRAADPVARIPGTVYRVGGAVRDKQLGLPVQETDWVVVGATPEAMQAAGFRPVGRDFPVFIHPQTGEEYALARTERKSAPGHTGFTLHAHPEVTLEEDLVRRDLTINAMAESRDGTLIDPYGGTADLATRRLRHVSPAFKEDPLRVLRVARFAARLADLGFQVAPETLALMRRMAASGELAWLTPERVWKEVENALGTPRPEAFFHVLQQCGALTVILPELVPAAERGCPRLRALVSRTPDTALRFAAVYLDAAAGHAPLDPEGLARRLRAPARVGQLADLAVRRTAALRQAGQADAEGLMRLLEQLDVLRRPERLDALLTLVEAEMEAEGARPGALRARLEGALAAARTVDTGTIARQSGGGPAAGEAIRRARIAAIGRFLDTSPRAEDADGR